MGYYYSSGHRLFLLGDIEELWERLLVSIVNRYETTLKLEQQFFKEARAIRFLGNHDESLRHPWNRSVIKPFIDNAPLYDGLRIHVKEKNQHLGDLLFLHGHQGIPYTWFHRFAVRRFWAPIQKLTGIGLGVPSSDHQLRQSHERVLYDWTASRSESLLLFCGHTHHPVFMSTALEESVRQELEKMKNDGFLPEDIAMKEAHLEWIKADASEIRSSLPNSAQPSYFNTGCCSFSNGEITGIEIADQKVRLIQWSGESGHPVRTILREAPLKSILKQCAHPEAK